MSIALLPSELVEHIAEDLCHDSTVDGRPFFNAALVQDFALVCRSFLPIGRRHLFSHIFVSIDSVNKAAKALAAVLQTSPEIASYTRHLFLLFHLDKSSEQGQLFVPTEFKMFSKLDSYEISNHGFYSAHTPELCCYLDFNKIGPETRDILLHPMRTVIFFKLNQAANFPFNRLLECRNIRDLELSRIKVDRSDDFSALIGTLPSKTTKLEGLRCSSGSPDHTTAIRKILGLRSGAVPIIDIAELEFLDLSCCDSVGWETARAMLLRTNEKLQTLILNINSEMPTLTGMGQPLLASRETLRELRITSYAKILDTNPLHGLCEELEIFGSRPNVLETLSYSLVVGPGFVCSTGTEWRALDQVIDSFPWPRLKTLSVDIITTGIPDVNLDIGDEDLDLDFIMVDFIRRLEALPKSQLPILYGGSRKELDFRFSVRQS